MNLEENMNRLTIDPILTDYWNLLKSTGGRGVVRKYRDEKLCGGGWILIVTDDVMERQIFLDDGTMERRHLQIKQMLWGLRLLAGFIPQEFLVL